MELKDITKFASKEWHDLSEALKQPWVDKAKKNHAEYKEKMEEYKLSKEKGDPKVVPNDVIPDKGKQTAKPTENNVLESSDEERKKAKAIKKETNESEDDDDDEDGASDSDEKKPAGSEDSEDTESEDEEEPQPAKKVKTK